ncbi:MAG: 30S ribosomal protein S20 [Pseudomonadota bacterium]
MANTKQAKKRARQAETHRERNAGQRSMLRTLIKKVRHGIANKDQKNAASAYQEAAPIIDRLASKKIIHKNAAARYKAHMNKEIKLLGK